MIEVRIGIGRFVLELGGRHGTRAVPGTRLVAEPRDALAQALARPPQPQSAAAAVGGVVDRAAEVTGALERMNDLAGAVAKGLTLDPRTLKTQLDALLDVFDRADREGRFDDELKLARSLVVLLGLVGRWIALLEVLRRTTAAAAAVGNLAADAWAHHELGSLALAGDDAAAASEQLNVALAARNALGDREGAAVTLHNLQLVGSIPAAGNGEPRRNIVRRHPVALAIVLALLLAGGVALAVALRDGDDEGAQTTASTATTDAGTTTETRAGDVDGPEVALAAPPRFSVGDVELTAAATDAGSGVESVTFQAAPDGRETFDDLGRVASAPYSLTWSTTGVEDGTYLLRATAVDREGNPGTSGTASTVVDNNGPTVTLGSLPESTDRGTPIVFEAKAEDAASGVASVSFRYRRVPPGTSAATAPADADWEPELAAEEVDGVYRVEFDTADRELGSYVVQALATDEAGNTGMSEEGTFSITGVD